MLANLRIGAVTAAILATVPALSQEQIDIQIPADDHVLAGTLTLPEGDGPFAAAVLISGSGPSDRDESLPGGAFRPFAQLAADLAHEGIATLRYDDRGVGYSTGDFRSATAFDFADDAQAAAAFLAKQAGVDPDRVGLVGHSEGGMIAPIVAARDKTIAFVVSIAGTAVPGYQVLAGQLRDALLSAPPDQRDALYAAQIHSLDLVVDRDWPALEGLLRNEYAAMPMELQRAAGSADDYVQQGMIFYRGWLYTFATHDPAGDWLRVNVPVLAIFGGRDVQVSFALNAPALRAALDSHPDTTINVLPTANHLFQDAPTGAVAEYATLPPAFASGFASSIARWITAYRAGPPLVPQASTP